VTERAVLLFAPAFVSSEKLVQRRGRGFKSDPHYRVWKLVIAGMAYKCGFKGLQQGLEAIRRKPPVVVWVRVNGKLHHRTYYGNASVFQNPVYFFHCLLRTFYVLERVQAQNRASGLIG
jgi:hypothetical protein